MLDRLQILNYENFNPSFIVDIGAHIGDFARECKHLWPKTDIHMFEANPNAREVLEQTGYPYTIGLLADTVGSKYTYYMTDKWLLSSGNSIYKENTSDFGDGHLKVVELISNTLDNLLDGRNIDLLKLDTQGSEIQILNGGLKAVGRTKYILIECSVYEYNAGGCLIGDVFDFMNKYNFKLKDVLDMNYLNEGLTLNQVDLLFERNG
jgi:FkbM family methyltransferase